MNKYYHFNMSDTSTLIKENNLDLSKECLCHVMIKFSSSRIELFYSDIFILSGKKKSDV